MEDQNDKKVQNNKNWLEWSVFSLSSLLIMALVSYFVYLAVTFRQSEPGLQVHCSPSGERRELNITVVNNGGTAAQEVKVEVTLKQESQEEEKAEIMFRYVPQESIRQGKVRFSTEPGKADTIAARIVSFIGM